MPMNISDEIIQPGPVVDFMDQHWMPTGTADGVFYLGERVAGDKLIPLGDGQQVWSKVILHPSKHDVAMRYVKPCTALWHDENPGRHGLIFFPDLRGMLRAFPKDLVQLAAQRGVRVEHQFNCQCPLASDPWMVTRGQVQWARTIEEDIWCVFLPSA